MATDGDRKAFFLNCLNGQTEEEGICWRKESGLAAETMINFRRGSPKRALVLEE